MIQEFEEETYFLHQLSMTFCITIVAYKKRKSEIKIQHAMYINKRQWIRKNSKSHYQQIIYANTMFILNY